MIAIEPALRCSAVVSARTAAIDVVPHAHAREIPALGISATPSRAIALAAAGRTTTSAGSRRPTAAGP